jgi:uncharacterized membrane protein YkvA (DUF1232 family)
MYRNLKIAAIVLGAAAYFAVPIDIVPDFLIGPGQLDDLAVIALAYKQIKKTIGDAKRSNSIENDNTAFPERE